ncbi:hypothetical protein Q7C36_021635 [Tachysurus vachellii]|uniref:C-type lectin domain-containing protein n=1 Tax=Tachysurus vachellii TaxID=175792 RepID=A0AA88LIJ6_TACVA|nr:hypothetical protein Q7C36_021635 [Tachysurus vachellii]
MKIFIVFVLITLDFSACDATSTKKCPDGWTGFGRKCYKYVSDVKSWAEAERYCQGLGGNLASVHSNQTQSLLKKMGKMSGSYKRTWIGAQDATQDSWWLWSDGSVFDFSAWHSGEPNHAGQQEHCVEMNYGDEVLWNDAKCNTKLFFVCQKAANIPNNCRSV